MTHDQNPDEIDETAAAEARQHGASLRAGFPTPTGTCRLTGGHRW